MRWKAAVWAKVICLDTMANSDTERFAKKRCMHAMGKRKDTRRIARCGIKQFLIAENITWALLLKFSCAGQNNCGTCRISSEQKLEALLCALLFPICASLLHTLHSLHGHWTAPCVPGFSCRVMPTPAYWRTKQLLLKTVTFGQQRIFHKEDEIRRE